MWNQSGRFVSIIFCAITLSSVANADGTSSPPVNPANAAGATEFDWQAEWGTIHMNSMADGLNDPGTFATHDGNLGCAIGKLCDQMKTTEKNRSNAAQLKGSNQIKNAIKYDIKNSLLNCMSRIAPTLAINNPWDSRTTVCKKQYGYKDTVYGDPLSLAYTPLWDRRANDDRAWNVEGSVGCQQAISNNCVRDMHDCVQNNQGAMHPDNPGYLYPVTHVFSPDEIKDLGIKGGQLPTVYYSYTKILTPEVKDEDGKVITAAKTRTALSVADPSGFADALPGSVKEIKNTSDPNLARLKSYFVTNEDQSKFIVVDPSDFFDLRLYSAGGKYDSGYNQSYVDNKGRKLVKTYDSCPALGLASGYSGICDPTGEAGCNLPIYQVGPTTTFKSIDGKDYTYSNYPIKWSGYVKKWAVISVADYEKNIKGREDYYLTGDDLNRNPIFMFTRSNEYCEAIERTSNPSSNGSLGTGAPDLPCIQYIQYQQTDKEGKYFEFIDLFNPVEHAFDSHSPEYNNMQLYDIGVVDPKTGEVKDSKPDVSKPVLGTGSDVYIGGDGTKTGYVSFLDQAAGAKNAADLNAQSTAPATSWWQLISSPARTNSTISKVGVYRNHYKEYQVKRDTKAAAVVPVYYPAVTRSVYTKAELAWDPKTGERTAGTPQYVIKGVNGEPDRYADGAGEHLGKFPVKVQVLKNGRMVEEIRWVVKPERGIGVVLSPGNTNVVRLNTPTILDGKKTTCVVMNLSAEAPRDLFIQTNSDVEYEQFLIQKAKGTNEALKYLSIRACTAKFMSSTAASAMTQDPIPAGSKSWVGLLSCNSLTQRPACNQTKIISAERYCQLENGSLASCDACAAAADPDAGMEYSNKTAGGHVMVSPVKDSSRCYFSASCYNNSATGCPSAGTSGGHVFCFAPETKITMADGSTKAIRDIAPGEEVLSFNAKSPHSFLNKARVKATAITKDQTIIVIETHVKGSRSIANNLKLTPSHKVVLANGRSVVAENLKAGDEILKGDGTTEIVERIKSHEKKITVYNLVLEEGSDGYVANGIRVMSYPILKGLEELTSLDGRESRRQQK